MYRGPICVWKTLPAVDCWVSPCGGDGSTGFWEADILAWGVKEDGYFLHIGSERMCESLFYESPRSAPLPMQWVTLHMTIQESINSLLSKSLSLSYTSSSTWNAFPKQIRSLNSDKAPNETGHCEIIPSLWGIGRRITVRGWPLAQAWKPIWKITKAKKSRVMAQVVECLHSKSEALISNLSTTKKKKKTHHLSPWATHCQVSLPIRLAKAKAFCHPPRYPQN
jgi:hypothetical protein